jgi:hypothetical protein
MCVVVEYRDGKIILVEIRSCSVDWKSGIYGE